MYQPGDKVVPTSHWIGGELKTSAPWRRAQEKNQPCLYIIDIQSENSRERIINIFEVVNVGTTVYVASDNEDSDSGDYFFEEELERYVELSPDRLFKELGMEE